MGDDDQDMTGRGGADGAGADHDAGREIDARRDEPGGEAAGIPEPMPGAPVESFAPAEPATPAAPAPPDPPPESWARAVPPALPPRPAAPPLPPQPDATLPTPRRRAVPPPPPLPSTTAPAPRRHAVPPPPPYASPPAYGREQAAGGTPPGPAPLTGPGPGRSATSLAPGARMWGWPAVALGVVVGFAPQVLLYLAALYGGALETETTMQEVTLFSAIVVLVSTGILYGWQTIAAWLFSLRLSREGLAGWGFARPSVAFFWTIPVALIVSYVISAVHEALVNPPPQDIVEQFPRSVAGGLLFFVIAVVAAPLFEEIFFRGFVYQGLRHSWGWWPAALGSAAIFSVAHLQITVFVPIFALGVGLAWVYERTGSLWTSIAMHAVFNGLAVLVWALGVA